ncbi:unnamed protein product [Phytophthora fragariaefolia]|uniref:Unnamed protein product n=1 Tax=Phytophthora fragariaefolia TaxID=1490495 RepID=A0A9W6YP12_9STRA|nr:unnamed protein product [Phytophthora fragariaefolia]
MTLGEQRADRNDQCPASSFENLMDGAHPRMASAAGTAAIRGVAFPHLWRQLRMAGWNAKRPSGRSNEWRNTTPDGTRVLIGESAVVEYTLTSCLENEAEQDMDKSTQVDSGQEVDNGAHSEGAQDVAKGAHAEGKSDERTSVQNARVCTEGALDVGLCAPTECKQNEGEQDVGFCAHGTTTHADGEKGEDAHDLNASQQNEGSSMDAEAKQVQGAHTECVQTVDESANNMGVVDEGTVEHNAVDVHASNEIQAQALYDEVRSSQIDTSVELTQGTVDALFSPPSSNEKHHELERQGVERLHGTVTRTFELSRSSLWVAITTETNRYAVQQVDRRAQALHAKQHEGRREMLQQIRRRIKSKKEYEAHEILHVVGLLVARMLCPQQRRFSAHRSMVEDGAVPAGNFGRYMARNRCADILRDLHFVDNEAPRTRDKLWKLRPVVDKPQQRFLAGWSLPTLFSFDEGVLPSTSRWNTSRMFMPDKPHRYGSKIFMTCDPWTAYCHRYEIEHCVSFIYSYVITYGRIGLLCLRMSLLPRFDMYAGKRRREDCVESTFDHKTGAAAVVRN